MPGRDKRRRSDSWGLFQTRGRAVEKGQPPNRRVRDTHKSRARSPRFPATLPAQYPADSGVGVSVLLRQAEIFERILRLLVHRDPLDCSVAEFVHIGATNNHLDPVTPLQVLGQGHYYEITGFDEFVGLHPSGFPSLAEFLQESPSLIKSEDAAPRTDCPREVQLEARSRVFDEGIPVLAVVRVDCGLDELHVLLRHRLLREAGSR